MNLHPSNQLVSVIVAISFSALLLLTISCNTRNEHADSSPLIDSIAGKFSLSYGETYGTYSNAIRDTIIIVKKGKFFEVQNRK